MTSTRAKEWLHLSRAHTENLKAMPSPLKERSRSIGTQAVHCAKNWDQVNLI